MGIHSTDFFAVTAKVNSPSLCTLYFFNNALLRVPIYWRASEASETLSGVTNGNRRYIYIYISYYIDTEKYCESFTVY